MLFISLNKMLLFTTQKEKEKNKIIQKILKISPFYSLIFTFFSPFSFSLFEKKQ